MEQKPNYDPSPEVLYKLAQGEGKSISFSLPLGRELLISIHDEAWHNGYDAGYSDGVKDARLVLKYAKEEN